MRLVFIHVTAVVLLLIPFLVLGAFYDALPNEVPILRGWDGSTGLNAPKSPLTVFRVSVIGVVMAAATELMRRHNWTGIDDVGSGKLQRMWLILLVTASAKALCEGIEFAMLASPVSTQYGGWFRNATIAIVAAGILAAALPFRDAWPVLRQREQWRFSTAEIVALTSLGAVYVAVAGAPILIAKR